MSLHRDALLWVFWHPFKHMVQRMPVGWVYGLGRLAGQALSRVARGRMGGLMAAGRVIRPEADEAELKRLARRAFVNFCCNDFEVLLFPRMNPAMMRRITEVEGLEHLDAALQRGRGAILMFGHFGANQMVMPAIGYRGYTLCQLSAPASVLNEKLPEKRGAMVRRTRELRWEHELSLPVTHINIFGPMKEAFRCLKQNHVLAIAMDGGGGERRVTVEFLGRPAHFSVGAFSIAQRTGAAVLPTFPVREHDGRNRIVIEPAMDLAEPGADDPKGEGAVAENTQRFARILERRVRQRPDHYMYFLSFRMLMAAGGDAAFIEGVV